LSRLSEIEKKWSDSVPCGSPTCEQDFDYLIDRCRKLEAVAEAAKIVYARLLEGHEGDPYIVSLHGTDVYEEALKALNEERQ
jgi:hypothetical protein